MSQKTCLRLCPHAVRATYCCAQMRTLQRLLQCPVHYWDIRHETENNLGPGLHGRADPFASGRCGGCRVYRRTGAPLIRCRSRRRSCGRTDRSAAAAAASDDVPLTQSRSRRSRPKNGRDGNGRAIHGAGRADGCDVHRRRHAAPERERELDAQHRRRNGADGGAGSLPPRRPRPLRSVDACTWPGGENPFLSKWFVLARW